MNRRIIVIDDEEAILKDYLSILMPPKHSIFDLQKQAAALEAELFDGPHEPEETEQEMYKVTTALQGEEGVKKVTEAVEKGYPFALAFVDIRMPPGWDGVETAKMIRRIDKNIEIIIVTAYSDRERREIINEVGSPERLLYLKKPFDPDEIKQLALSLVKKWDLERKSERHREHLRHLLDSVRRLKTLSISSISEVLSAILNEVLNFVNAGKGFLIKLDGDQVQVEIVAGDLTSSEVDSLVDKIQHYLPGAEGVSQVNEIMLLPLKDASGNFFILVTEFHPPINDDRISLLRLLLETCSEVLESVRKQEQYLKNEKIATIGQVAAGIIHEINNPLTAIVCATEMGSLERERVWRLIDDYEKTMADAEVPSWLRERIERVTTQAGATDIRTKMTNFDAIIKNGIKRVVHLMKSIKSLTKPVHNFEPRLGDLNEALDTTLLLVQNSIKYGIKVHKELDSPLMVWCDMDGLGQVFLNLILNAVQAMNGRGELWITGKKQGGNLLVSIRDSGPGISEEARNKIFDAFFTTKTDGTGLGLSIVKGIIEMHHGTIEVDSKVGRGTTFNIVIPCDWKPPESLGGSA
ncbi:MAG: response regulator [Deltaproteobacteria bacterium]|nr:response regulator [Deltaproteobacteria bacterium]MBF0526485.1 response regulator [Deltaproteobacteria bacterium]